MRHFFLTSMCALVLVGCKSSYEKGFDSGYDDGFAQTYQNAFDEGYADGHNEGQVAGHEDGYNAGHADGYTQGFDQARDDFARPDYLSGYDDGNAQGYSDGYDTGHADGMVDGGVDGYADGATDGYNDGYGYGHSDYYNNGYDDGWADGRFNGYSDGSYDGASDGYNDGYDDEYDWAYDSNYDDGYDDGYGDGYYGFSTKSHSPMARLAQQVNSDLINYSSLKKFDSGSTLEQGSIVYSADAGSVDIEKLAALKERHYLNQMSSQLSARFGLSFESAGRIATIAHQFNRLAGSRVLTDEDASAFSKELIGFDMGEIENAVKKSMRGESADLNRLLEEASGKVGVTPEKMNRMISELFY